MNEMKLPFLLMKKIIIKEKCKAKVSSKESKQNDTEQTKVNKNKMIVH